MSDFSCVFNEMSELLQMGKSKDLVVVVEKALHDGAAPADILENGLIPGMHIIGEKFKNQIIFIPDMLIAARAMSKASAALKPALVTAGVQPVGRAIICTVSGDLHDIGKNLVKMMLEGKGIEVIDLGVDCNVSKIIETVRESDAKVLCLSALLTTTMENQKEAIDALKEAGLRDKVKVMVGGAPITQEYADEIGADAFAPDAAFAAEVCRAFFD
jgi:5-methyltetrahydrofolate--homocysteine methyltransferase